MPDFRDEIQLWTLPLDRRPEDLGLLRRRERDRAERLTIAAKRDQFVAAQAGLRRVLGLYLDIPASTVRFDYREHGKPFVASCPELCFNLTHSGRLALVAVTRRAEIGIDLEEIGRDRPFLRLARRYFAASEHAWLAEQGPEDTRRAFYRTWTLKEAYLKAIGTGLRFATDGFEFDLTRSPAALRTTSYPGDTPESWFFIEPKVAATHVAAICCAGSRRALRVRKATEFAAVSE
jgi:4'-phosphopantetheinyl transferase